MVLPVSWLIPKLCPISCATVTYGPMVLRKSHCWYSILKIGKPSNFKWHNDLEYYNFEIYFDVKNSKVWSQSTIKPYFYKSTLTYHILNHYIWFTIARIKQIMAIELGGVQLRLKSYAWFQNWTSAQSEFDLKPQVWFQTKISRQEVQLPINYIYLVVAIYNQEVMLFC